MATTTAVRRGRPRRLTLEQVLEAAIAVVESGGAPALTMEAVAHELGVGTMTLYGYVDSRDDLIDRTVAHLLAEGPQIPVGRNKDWIEVVVEYCLAVRRWIVARPALLLLNAERPHLSDVIAANYSEELRGLVRAGFCIEDAVVVRHAIAVLMLGQIQSEQVARAAEQSGVARSNRKRARERDIPAIVAQASKAPISTDPEALYERSLRALLAGFSRSLPR